MKLGYFTLVDNLPILGDERQRSDDMIKNTVEHAIACDSLGYRSFWVAEHHGPSFGQLPAPAAYLGYLAAATKRIRLGPACVILPVAHPIRIAEEYAVLDHLSDGRIAVAVGRGNDLGDHGAFGVGYEQTRPMLSEGIDLLRRAWTEPGFTFDGDYWKVADPFTLNVYPKQQPHPDLYVAAYSPPTVELTARLGLNLMMSPFGIGMAYHGLDKAVATFREAAAQAGHSADLKIVCSYYCGIARDSAEADRHRERLLRYLHGLLGLAELRTNMQERTPLSEGRRRVLEMKPSDLGMDMILAGDAEAIIEKLKWCESLGVDEVILDFDFCGFSSFETLDQIERVAYEVLPAFGQA